jgi:exosortase
MTAPAASPRPAFTARAALPLLTLAVPALCLLWAFWTTLVDLAQTWNTNPQYSHGFLIPGFALLLLWMRKDQLDRTALRPSWWGLLLLAAGLGLRLAGTYYYFVWLDPISLVPCVAGLTLLLGGRAAWRWAWPAVLFLTFMIPLPYRLANSLSGPLQRLATVTSTFVMQTFGLPALAEGNVILVNDHEINIVEACSGLRMLVVFFALSTAVGLIIRRHWIDKVIILASAVPIALASNVFRVTATGVMYEAGYSEMANAFFHDAAGWLMMPVGLGLLWVELKVLSHLFLDLPAPLPRGPAARRTPAPRAPAEPRSRRPAASPRPTAGPRQNPPPARRRDPEPRAAEPREPDGERVAEPTAKKA